MVSIRRDGHSCLHAQVGECRGPIRIVLDEDHAAPTGVGIACGLFITAIHRMGLVTLTHTPSPMGFLARILERPRSERPFLLLPVGYPATDCTVPDLARKSLDEVAVFVEG